MRIAGESIEKITLVLEKPKRILKAFCIGPVNNPLENGYFNFDLDKIFLSRDITIEENKNISLKSGEQYKVFYIDKTMNLKTALIFQSIFLKTINDSSYLQMYIPVLERKQFFVLEKNSRMKVWLNSTLIFNGHPNDSEWNTVLVTLNEGTTCF